MKKILEKVKPFAPLLAVVIIAVLAIHSIGGYEPAVFDLIEKLKASEPKETESAPEDTTFVEEELPEKTQEVQKAEITIKKVKEAGEYQDGTYYGSAKGFAGTVTVKVVIKASKIESVTVLSHSDGAEYMKKAKALLKRIVKKQTTNLDAVSGATYSSNGIINATRAALEKASIQKKKKKADENKKTEKKSQSTNKKLEGDYKDGTYTGTAKGYLNGTTSVDVTIASNVITKITINSHEDTTEFMEMAKDTIISSILKEQKTSVDVVSGATFSSRGIMNAVANALEQAKKNDGTEEAPEEEQEPEGEITEIKKSSWVVPDGDNFSTYSLKLLVQITNGKIYNVSFMESNKFGSLPANQSYSEYALEELLKKVKGKTTLEGIDSVSGATCSSRAILEAVQEALDEYLEKTEESNEGYNNQTNRYYRNCWNPVRL